MIINGRQKRGKKGLELLVTLLGWSYMISAAAQIFFTLLMWIINIFFATNQLLFHNDMEKTTRVVSISIAVAAASFMILFYWSEYNYRRYGKLRRRRFAGTVSNKELAEYFDIEEAQIEQLQQNRWTEMDRTIV